MVDSQILTACVACGMAADDTHHGQHRDLSQGKGAGGTKHDDDAHFAHLPLCRKDHDACHAKTIRLTIHDGIVRTQTGDGELIGERAIVFDDEKIPEVERAEDFPTARALLPFISDEGLGYLWEQANRFATQGFMYQCIIADALHQRYGGRGGRWYERAAELIGASHQVVYERYRSWQFLKDVAEPETELERLGRATVEALGTRALKGEDAAGLADEADKALSAGMTRTAAAKALRAGDDHRELPCANGEHKCRWCAEVYQV